MPVLARRTLQQLHTNIHTAENRRRAKLMVYLNIVRAIPHTCRSAVLRPDKNSLRKKKRPAEWQAFIIMMSLVLPDGTQAGSGTTRATITAILTKITAPANQTLSFTRQ